MEFEIDQGFTVVKKLQRGAEGVPYLVRDRENRLYVRKVPNDRKGLPAKVVLWEAHVYFAILHARAWFTVKPVSFDFDNDTKDISRIVTLYCDGGDLHRVLEGFYKLNQAPPESFMWHLLLHLCSGAIWMHTGIGYLTKEQQGRSTAPYWLPVMHRDIHSGNIFLQHTNRLDVSSPYPDILLGDFGHSKVLGGPPHECFWPAGLLLADPPRDNRCGAPTMNPPERGPNGDVAPKPDVRYDYYQIGKMLWMFASSDLSPYTEQFRNVITDLTKLKPEDRPSDETLLAYLPVFQKNRDQTFECEMRSGYMFPLSVFGGESHHFLANYRRFIKSRPVQLNPMATEFMPGRLQALPLQPLPVFLPYPSTPIPPTPRIAAAWPILRQRLPSFSDLLDSLRHGTAPNRGLSPTRDVTCRKTSGQAKRRSPTRGSSRRRPIAGIADVEPLRADTPRPSSESRNRGASAVAPRRRGAISVPKMTDSGGGESPEPAVSVINVQLTDIIFAPGRPTVEAMSGQVAAMAAMLSKQTLHEEAR